MKRIILFFLVPTVGSILHAQNVVTKGKIIDENGEPIIGATIMVKGTNLGTVSDLDGNFTIIAPMGSILVISYIGYQTVEVKVTGALLCIQMIPGTVAIKVDINEPYWIPFFEIKS